MPRCNECTTCLSVIEFRKSNRKNRKKIKRYESNNVCEDNTLPAAKRRLTEVQALDTVNYEVNSGRVVDINIYHQPILYVNTDSKVRATRPDGSYDKNIDFDEVAFDNYAQLVLRCNDIAKTTVSSDVKLETLSMISKMRGLLNPKVKAEVDYEEAAKDASNVWLRWSQGEAAGKQAFIPTIEDHNECYAALMIFSHAGDLQ